MMDETRTATILLVDDDEDFLFQERTMLESAGFEVITAGGRAEAEDRLKDLRPDLAVVDLMMEELDAGFTLCYQIKQKDASIPVILITAVTAETGMTFDVETNEERSWVRADAVLTKPVRPEQLKREVDRLLEAC